MSNKWFNIVVLLFIFCLLSSCAGYMHGYTKDRAFGRYLLVDEQAENFGYKRMQYIQGYRPSIEGFVNKHGLPDFIYEFETENDREGIRLYYVNEDIVYVFVEYSWRPSSAFLSEHRELTDYENATYIELKKTSSI